jgi:hypothetical protein
MEASRAFHKLVRESPVNSPKSVGSAACFGSSEKLWFRACEKSTAFVLSVHVEGTHSK